LPALRKRLRPAATLCLPMNKPFALLLLLILVVSPAFAEERAFVPFVPDVSHQVFRDDVVAHVRAFAEEALGPASTGEPQALESRWDSDYQRSNWQVTIDAYRHGEQVGEGHAEGRELMPALKQATLDAMSAATDADAGLDDFRFKVSFDYYPSRRHSLLDYRGGGVELLGSRVALRQLTTADLQWEIDAGVAYLLRQQHPTYHGFFRAYDAKNDEAEVLLRTTYSATALFSLIKAHRLRPELGLDRAFAPIAAFLLDRQLTSGPHAGGFDYGVNPETGEATCRVVVGTTSKTIYSLLLMHQHAPEAPRYLDAARRAGDWLLTMTKDDGNVIPKATCRDGAWRLHDGRSFLYTGEVLSALSRLYQATGDPRYLAGARRIGGMLTNEVERQGPLVADDFRPANSISSSWVLMSLMDLAKVDPKPNYYQTIVRVAEALLEQQFDDPKDVANHGRYLDTTTTSGNGWINEVMGDWYVFCARQQITDCQPYREAMWRTSRWLVQNAYNAINSYAIKDPDQARGGMITNFKTPSVRTDAVCHGLNGLISLIQIEGARDEPLLSLPEPPLRKVLPLLRAGN
jgi:hypothetical protein